MNRSRELAVAASVIFLTVTAMAALVAEKTKVVAVCKDVRIGMDAALQAKVLVAGLSKQFSLEIEKQHYRGNEKVTTIDVSKDNSSKSSETFAADNLTLVVAKNSDPNTDKYQALMNGEVAGEKIAIKMACVSR